MMLQREVPWVKYRIGEEIWLEDKDGISSLQWRHNEHDGVSNHQPHDCLLNRLFMHISTKTSRLRVTGLCEGNSPVTGEFHAQGASNPEMFSFDDVIMVMVANVF